MLVVGVATSAGACGSGRPAAAEVNGSKVSAKLLDDLLGALAPSVPQFKGGGKGTFGADGASSVLSFLVERQLVAGLTAERGLEISDADRTAGRTRLLATLGQDEAASKEVFDRLSKSNQDHLVEVEAAQVALQADLGKDEDPEVQARETYEANRSQYTNVCLSALTIADQAALTAVRARLARGEAFADVAKEVSIDDSAENGGELECIPLSQISDAEALKQIGAAEKGDVIGPIGQPGQLVLVLVRDRQQQTYDEAKAAILQSLPPPGQAELDAFVAPMRSKARITVDPRYGRWDAKAARVVPPKPPRGATTSNRLVPTEPAPASQPAGG